MSRATIEIKTEHCDALRKCAEVTGRSYQSLVDEAMQYFVEAYVPTYIEYAAEQSGHA